MILNQKIVSDKVIEILKNESGFDILVENPKLKMGISPTVWFFADKFAIRNDDGSYALNTEKPIVEVDLLSLLIFRLNIKYFGADNIFAVLSCDKNLNLKLGQYLIVKPSDSNIKLSKANISLDEYEFILKDDNVLDDIKISGDYLYSKFKKNSIIKFNTVFSIYSGRHLSNSAIDVSCKLPLKKNLAHYKPDINISIANLQLSSFSNFIRYFTDDNVQSIAGLVNVDFSSGKNFEKQKQYEFLSIIKNLKIESKYLTKPYIFDDRIDIKSNFLIQNDDISISNAVFATKDFSLKLTGGIDKVSSKNPIPNLRLRLFNAKAKDLLKLAPYSPEFDKLIKVSPSTARDANFSADVNFDLKITDNLKQPKINGDLTVDNAFVYYPIPTAPKGADIKIKFQDYKMLLDVMVPTAPSQFVKVVGSINTYGENYADLHITSTPLINLSDAERVLMPVHKTFDFQLGPVPIMYFSGFGNIDLKVKGTKKDPYCYGKFQAVNANVGFDDIHNFTLNNGNALLTFDEKMTNFTLKSGTLNGKPVNIDGTCTLEGKLNFTAKMLNQDLGYLLNVLKTSPMLNGINKAADAVERANGNSDLIIKLDGQVKTIEELKIAETMHAKGEITLKSNNIKIINIPQPVKNVTGSIKFNDFDLIFDLKTKVANSIISFVGPVKKGIANIKFNTDKLKLSDLFLLIGINNFVYSQTPEQDLSYLKLAGSYNGKIENFEMNKINLSGLVYFKNLNFIYKPLNIPLKLVSGQIDVYKNNLIIRKLNTQIATMPLLLDAEINNIFVKPYIDAYISSKPNQKFFDTVYNKNAIYPIKAKGDITYSGTVSGPLNKINARSNLKIDTAGSLYYMGASVGDDTSLISLVANTIFEPNKLTVKSIYYDKLIKSQNNKYVPNRQITTSGDLWYSKDNIGFKNFRIKTSTPTDTRIFNVIFKKPLIKEGLFTSDILLNGTASNLAVRGPLNLVGMNIPVMGTNLKNVLLQFNAKTIAINSVGEFLDNSFKFSATAVNNLTLPIVVKNAELYVGNFNVNTVLDAINKYEVESAKNIENISTSAQLPLNQLIIEKFNIFAKNIHFNNINANDLRTSFSFKNEKFNVNNFNFKIAGGELSGKAEHQIGSKKSVLTMVVKSVDADTLIYSILNLKGQLYGNIDGYIDAYCTGYEQNDCLKTLTGNINFNVNNGRLPKLGSLEYLLRAGNLLKSGITGLSINGIIDLVSPLKTGDFDSIRGDIIVSDGIANDIKILSNSKNMNIFITGNYDCATNNADMYVFGRLARKVSNLLGPIGNVSLNTLFNTIPGVNLNAPENASMLKEINKIPGLELSNKLYRIFAVEVHGDIGGEDYVESFRWIE